MPAMHREAQAHALYLGLPAGHEIRNPALAATLRAIARHGAAEFYEGDTAHRIAGSVARAGGTLSRADLAAYRARAAAPLSFHAAGMTVEGAGMPTYGALAAGQIIGICAALGLHSLPLEPDLEALHLLACAGRIAQADRYPYADPAFAALDAQALLDPAYLAERAKLFSPARLPPHYPRGGEAGSQTSHLCLVDRDGQLVSMTTTINQNFGSQIAVGGFYLNNVMTNFTADPASPNAAAPRKRARTTIGPSIVSNPDGTPLALLGAGGGHRIIGYVANAILRLAGGARDPAAILAAPHVLNWDGDTDLEPPLARHAPALTARGHRVTTKRLEAAAQMIVLHDGRPHAAGDLRRDGAGMAEKL